MKFNFLEFVSYQGGFVVATFDDGNRYRRASAELTGDSPESLIDCLMELICDIRELVDT